MYQLKICINCLFYFTSIRISCSLNDHFGTFWDLKVDAESKSLICIQDSFRFFIVTIILLLNIIILNDIPSNEYLINKGKPIYWPMYINPHA